MTSGMDRPVPERSRRRRLGVRLALVAAVLLAVGGTSWAVLSGVRATVRMPRQSVTLDTVAQGVFHDVTPLRGAVVPHDTVLLDALEGGQIAKVLARGGDVVVAGQPLLVFRNSQLELDVLDREGRLVESITQLLSYEKQLEDTRLANAKAIAEIDYNLTRLGRASDRREPLSAKDYVSAESIDQIHDELAYNRRLKPIQDRTNASEEALRRRQLPAIRAQVRGLREDLRITRAKLDDLIVRAPIAGRLADLVDQLGQNFSRGDRLGEVVANTGFKIRAAVDEYYLQRVRIGETAVIDIDGRSWPLRVTRVYPKVKDSTFAVDLEFIGAAPQGLLSGEAVDGKLTLGGDRPALILPAGAFLDRTGGDWVMVVSAQGGAAERRRIKIGRRNADQVEILSGLKPGEQVITSDYAAFEKADRVKLTR